MQEMKPERRIAEEIASATLKQVEEDEEQEKIQCQQQRRQALLEQKERLIAQCSKEKDQLVFCNRKWTFN